MSVDLNWESLTGGQDGEARAERIRSFIHDKFQMVPFPKFIKSVQVHSFSFGTVAPDIEIKEICDPYPEFYEQDDEDASDSDSVDGHSEEYLLKLERELRRRERKQDASVATPASRTSSQPPPYSVDGPPRLGPFRPQMPSGIPDSFPGRVGVTGVTTPLFSPMPHGSSSNLHYFHSALSSNFNNPLSTPNRDFHHASSVSSSSQSLRSNGSLHASNLPSGIGQSQQQGPTTPARNPRFSGPDSPTSLRRPFSDDGDQSTFPPAPVPRLWEPRDEDTQIIARVRYSGDVRIELTAELLFEYPVSNFVALPVRLVVTGCNFDGLACVAYIRRRAHFCFLDEDPEAAEEGTRAGERAPAFGGKSLLKQINVESEIGEKGKGKQVLKNVGKVERFVLDQVRRIFEEEFVFPSSWTFLV